MLSSEAAQSTDVNKIRRCMLRCQLLAARAIRERGLKEVAAKNWGEPPLRVSLFESLISENAIKSSIVFECF